MIDWLIAGYELKLRSANDARPEAVIEKVHDLELTFIWMKTPGGRHSIGTGMGHFQTIAGFFKSVETAFVKKYGSAFQLGKLQGISLHFDDLGPEFEVTRTLTFKDDDKVLKKLRWDLLRGYEDNREESMVEIEVGWAIAYFEHDKW